ncbi:DUF4238 domain-containing protein [Agrobacterium tumefaciens]|uniref:DUF4238 domain-containing protein n=1 Tax=Agrobacterium tumefaciens TaxID=358 RepID=UPI001CC15015|nr:DUF4238 domain-containing protein [Agrobacterium tumefaciens]
MAPNEPRDHHYVPQFFLRNFAVDQEKTRITTVGKHGPMAIWSERSIENLGYERDFYVHMRDGIPVSVETDINRRVETPISQSDTWAKIASGQTDALDRSDRAIRGRNKSSPKSYAKVERNRNDAVDPMCNIRSLWIATDMRQF